MAIVGGGPGGLMTAYLLQKSANRPLDVTVFEATERLGGKILTPTFRTAPVKYEAGAAEFYDYSPVDDDRLKELVDELELPISRMGGNSVALDGEILGHLDDVERICGPEVRRSLLRFHWAARSQLSPIEFFNLGGPEAPPRVSTAARFDKFLDAIDDPLARTHVETLIHSDLATEPEQTSVDYGLQNYLMNDPAYMQLYGIDGGNEQLPRRLASRIVANFSLRRSVTEIGAGESGRVRVTSRATAKPNSTTETRVTADEFDYVVLALPHDAL
ncbi:MAG TPA: FAD-dependent oxidoreductase, partial [Pirellulaceae bacterium]|nr:FAD-dependent oxidoreductase [Pirellulaceae bacterium]